MVVGKKRFQAKILDSWTWLVTLPCIPIFIFFIKNIIDSVNVYNKTNTINFFEIFFSNSTLCLHECNTSSATFHWLLQFDARWFYGKNNFNIIFGILFIGLNLHRVRSHIWTNQTSKGLHWSATINELG